LTYERVMDIRSKHLSPTSNPAYNKPVLLTEVNSLKRKQLLGFQNNTRPNRMLSGDASAKRGSDQRFMQQRMADTLLDNRNANEFCQSRTRLSITDSLSDFR